MKRLLSVAFFSLTGLLLNAQQNTFGIRTGLGRSTLKTDYAGSDSDFVSKGKILAYVSVFLEHKIDPHFALQGELGISNVGGRNSWYQDQDFNDYKIVNAISIGRINVPLMAKYYFNEKMNINAGVNLALNIEAESKYRTNGYNGLELFANLLYETENIKTYVKTFEANPFLGAEFHFNDRLFLDARYVFGVYNVGKNIHGEGFETLKNSFLQVGIGFKIKK
ncbi:porin family protein [Chryseobacterium sp. JUb7]|uniref:porin family protein n=1 Tax=Chryseobacterium sp. JUb7 TaxID=2940599 RepID=UPI00216A35D2|nr:porin family protein [Chryseobacterium sp. JUb7]MCS3528782.1 hypothetical protein [Chryseobacterium sp. JUb7]